MKILLNYKPETGEITGDDGILITTWSGLERHEAQDAIDADALCKLKAAGYEVNEIITMRSAGLI